MDLWKLTAAGLFVVAAGIAVSLRRWALAAVMLTIVFMLVQAA